LVGAFLGVGRCPVATGKRYSLPRSKALASSVTFYGNIKKKSLMKKKRSEARRVDSDNSVQSKARHVTHSPTSIVVVVEIAENIEVG
jgi:hypothetical protein